MGVAIVKPGSLAQSLTNPMAHPIHPWPSIPLHLVPSPPFPNSLLFSRLLSYHRLPAISPPLLPFFCTLSASSKAFFLLELATLLSLSTLISSVKPSITQSQRPNDSASPPPPKQATLPSCYPSDDNTSTINQYIQLGHHREEEASLTCVVCRCLDFQVLVRLEPIAPFRYL